MTSEANRPYRKTISTPGKIFLAGEEYDVTVHNVSITGALICLEKVHADEESLIDIFFKLQKTTKCDVFIPSLNIAGEVSIVRVDSSPDDHFLLAVEFRHISHHINGTLYKRGAYRKDLQVAGRILFNEKQYDFVTVNVSLTGCMIHIKEAVLVEHGVVTRFAFEKPKVVGDVEVAWVEVTDNQETYIGLHYLNISADRIKGLPTFADV